MNQGPRPATSRGQVDGPCPVGFGAPEGSSMTAVVSGLGSDRTGFSERGASDLPPSCVAPSCVAPSGMAEGPVAERPAGGASSLGVRAPAANQSGSADDGLALVPG